jgi:hypothetical protein
MEQREILLKVNNIITKIYFWSLLGDLLYLEIGFEEVLESLG